uniref:Melatonin receptor type 1A n=3 Tax=Lygus hesperus TaxID=30085 RepID=A0A146LYC3_LYGHE
MIGPVLGLGLSLVSLLGVAVNFYIVVVVFLAKQVRVESGGAARILLAQLGIVGFFTSTIFLATETMQYFNMEPIIPCDVSGTTLMILHPMALFNIVGLNCDRYLAIAAPLHYSSLVKPRKVLLIVGLAWALCISLAVVPHTFTSFRTNPITFDCRPVLYILGGFVFVCVYSIATFIIPVSIVVFCNIKVLMIARHHRHRIARAIFEVTLSAQVTITHQKNPFLLPQSTSAGRYRSATTTIMQITFSLVVLYSLNYVIFLLESIGMALSNDLYYTSLALHVISSPYNAFMYGLKNKLLRRAFRHYWRKKMTKCELDLEIQARTPSRRPSITPQRVHQEVGRPASAGVINQSTPRPSALRHSVTSASLLVTKKYSNHGKKRSKPTILVTKPGSGDDMVVSLGERSHYKLGGSVSSMSGDSDVTQEDWGAPHWHLCSSSMSLPTRPDEHIPLR